MRRVQVMEEMGWTRRKANVEEEWHSEMRQKAHEL